MSAYVGKSKDETKITLSQQNCADSKIQIADQMCFPIMGYTGGTVYILKLTSNDLFVLLSSFTYHFDSLQWNTLLTVLCHLFPLIPAEQTTRTGTD